MVLIEHSINFEFAKKKNIFIVKPVIKMGRDHAFRKGIKKTLLFINQYYERIGKNM